jgi:hypothetical protein
VYFNGSPADGKLFFYAYITKSGDYFILDPDTEKSVVYSNLTGEQFTQIKTRAEAKIGRVISVAQLNGSQNAFGKEAGLRQKGKAVTAERYLLDFLSETESREKIVADHLMSSGFTGTKANIVRKYLDGLLRPDLLQKLSAKMVKDKAVLKAVRSDMKGSSELTKNALVSAVADYVGDLPGEGFHLIESRDKRILLRTTFKIRDGAPGGYCGSFIRGKRSSVNRYFLQQYRSLPYDVLEEFFRAAGNSARAGVTGTRLRTPLQPWQKERVGQVLSEYLDKPFSKLSMSERYAVREAVSGGKNTTEHGKCLAQKLLIETVLSIPGKEGDWALEVAVEKNGR